MDILWHMALPLMILVILRTASYYMLMKSTVQTIRDEEYITVARGKGVLSGTGAPPPRTEKRPLPLPDLRMHAVRPYSGRLHAGGGGVLLEGMGTLIYDAVNTKDFPILQTCFLFIGICVVAFNLLADVLNMLIDPPAEGGGPPCVRN